MIHSEATQFIDQTRHLNVDHQRHSQHLLSVYFTNARLAEAIIRFMRDLPCCVTESRWHRWLAIDSSSEAAL